MANNQRILHSHLPNRSVPVKGSAENIEVGDFVFQDNRFQGNTSQITLRPASAGSVGSSAGDGRYQFANLFAGVATQRHDQYSFDKHGFSVSPDCEVEVLIANSTGIATAATSDIPPGTKVGIAVNSSFRPIDDMVQIDGHHSVTVADNQAIGYTARIVKSGERSVRVHVKSMQVFSQTGI